MWETRPIETFVKKKLRKDHGNVKGEEIFSGYLLMRNRLVEDVLQEIKAIQPDLTDHGPEHVKSVLDNAEKLLGDNGKALNGTELYCLISAILFHDAGNIFDRVDHQRRIAKIYDFAHPGHETTQEKSLILKVVCAHCGQAPDGSKDTLKYVDDNSSLFGKPVRLRQIAAILRFADELAEGPNRTSEFIKSLGRYPEPNSIYHSYASITNIQIDRDNERIALTYHINLGVDQDGNFPATSAQEVNTLLSFAYERIIKLNQERQYNKHYCNYLNPFKKTTVAINFWMDNEPVEIGLPRVEITDIVLPDDPQKTFEQYEEDYKRDNVIDKIKHYISRGRP